METTIRLATENDFDEIAYIERRCFDAKIAYSKEKLLREYELVKERFYVVEAHGTMIAYFWSELWHITDHHINLRTMQDNIHTPDGNVLYIGNISVLPELRGHKIGAKMMSYMLKELPTVQYSLLAVPIDSIGAKVVYDRLGYKLVNNFSDYYAKGKHAAVMVLPGGRWNEVNTLDKVK